MCSRSLGVDLQALRRHRSLVARCALAIYLLAMAVTMASSLARPGSLQVVCTGSGGMALVSMDDDHPEPRGGMAHHCPLCASAALPLLPSPARVEPAAPLAHALRPVAAAWISWATAPPLPSRGPPAASA